MFCLQYVGNLKSCQKDEQAALVLKLHDLSQLTWQQILAAHRHGLGCEKILMTSVKVSLPAIARKEPHVLAFRFSGKKPMLGLRSGAVFRILHVDRDFTAYNHG